MNIAIIGFDLSQTSQIEHALTLPNEPSHTPVTFQYVSLEFMLSAQWLNEAFDFFILNDFELASQVSLLKSIRRQRKSYIPIIVLSSTKTEAGVVALLDAGADDCIYQPFRPRELFARIQCLLSQVAQISAATKKAGKQALSPSEALNSPSARLSASIFVDYAFHSVSLLVTFFGRKVQLSHMEFKLALYLFENMDNPLARKKISEYLWGVEHDSSNRSLDTLVNKIKRKLELTPEHGYRLRTVYGFGYRLQRVEERIRKLYQIK